MERTVVALFDDLNLAHRAVDDLVRSGFDRNHISVVRANREDLRTKGTTTTTDMPDASGTAAGAGIGAILGGIAGLVVGAGALAIPGIGPIVAAGPLAAALAGAGIGAATGGIIGALADAGIPETDAEYYAEGVRRGGTLVTVRSDDARTSDAMQILNRHSPVDIERRVSEWRSTGWSRFDPNAPAYSGTDKSASSTGYSGMGTGSTTHRFEDFAHDFRSDWQTRYKTLGFDYGRYEPAYRYGFEAHNRYSGRDWSSIEPELRKDWQRTYPNEAWEDFKDAARTGWERFKSGVSEMGRDMERGFDRTTSAMSRSFNDYDRDFRSNFEQSYRTGRYDYEHYRPAYQYGYDLAREKRYRDRPWNEIETDVRRDWEMRHPGDAWEDFKDAVRHAWQRVKADVRDAVD
jgi:uncharacterized membrane protein